MTEPFGRFRRFLRELKRRNVYKVAVTYLAVAFVGLQAVDLLIPATTLPSWADAFLLAILIVGFPVTLVVAWAFEMTPEGMRRTQTAEGEESVGASYPWGGLALVVALAGGVWYATTGDGNGSPPETSASANSPQTTEEPTGRSAAHDRPFVAVLPLENLSPDEENRFFAAGVHEEILTQLSKVSGLGVFARTTMEQYADSEKTVYEIGQELGAAAVLEGSVRRADGRVRITVQLIDPQSRDHAWSNTYDQALSTDAIFDIQASIAERITSALETELTGAEQTRIAESPTPNMDAYDAFLKGRDHLWTQYREFKPVALDSAVVDLQRAVARDASFAQAHGLLGVAYGRRLGVTDNPVWRDSALMAAERAIEIHAGVPEAHLARATVYAEADSLDAAVEELNRVLQARPGHPMASQMMARAHSERGDLPSALPWALRSARQAPRDPARIGDLIWILLRLEFFDAAEAWARYGLEHNPDNRMLTDQLVWSHYERGELGKGRRILQRYLEKHPDKPLALYAAGTVELSLGHPTQALELFERGESRFNEAFPNESPSFPEPPAPPDWARLAVGAAHLQAGDRGQGRAVLAELAREYRTLISRTQAPDPDALAGLAGVKSLIGQSAAVRDDLRLAVESGLSDRWLFKQPYLFPDLRDKPWFERMNRQAEVNLAVQQKKVREMVLDLYPSGVRLDTAQPGE